jgi:hypothetical protein
VAAALRALIEAVPKIARQNKLPENGIVCFAGHGLRPASSPPNSRPSNPVNQAQP